MILTLVIGHGHHKTVFIICIVYSLRSLYDFGMKARWKVLTNVGITGTHSRQTKTTLELLNWVRSNQSRMPCSSVYNGDTLGIHHVVFFGIAYILKFE